MAKEEKQNKTKQTNTHLKQLQKNYVSASLQCGFQVVCIRIKWALIKCRFPSSTTWIQRGRGGTRDLYFKAASSVFRHK